MSPRRALLLGGLTVALLDGLDAVVFFGLRGVPAGRIFQAIASGLLGPVAFQGGLATIALGVLLHVVIATTIVAVYFRLAANVPLLIRHPVPAGFAYGTAVWVVMNFAVIPLSASVRGEITFPVLLNGLLIHMLGVGLPAALFARAALRPGGTRRR